MHLIYMFFPCEREVAEVSSGQAAEQYEERSSSETLEVIVRDDCVRHYHLFTSGRSDMYSKSRHLTAAMPDVRKTLHGIGG